jgi:alkaline phosphatase D
MNSFTRRLLLKLSSVGTGVLSFFSPRPSEAKAELIVANPFHSRWHLTNDRVFLGGEYWANPMEDWRVSNGSAECQTLGGFRNIQLLTHQIVKPEGRFRMSVAFDQIEVGKLDGGAGFQVGIRSDINEYRSNSFAKNGVKAGVVNGKLTLGKNSTSVFPQLKKPTDVTLELSGKVRDQQYELLLVASDSRGAEIGRLQGRFPKKNLVGNVALVSNYDPAIKRLQGSRHRFRNWKVEGDAFDVDQSRRFGPLLWSMYTLHDSRSESGFCLKLTALTGPLGKKDGKKVELQTLGTAGYQTIANAELDRDAWTAIFSIPNWDSSKSVKYRVVYNEELKDGSSSASYWEGIIRPNPSGRPLRIGALTCQNDYAFPYEPVANNVASLDPDLLYFSGDQLYENHGGYGLIRDPADPAILNYLRKFYQFGWSFRQAMKNRPTVCLPDDHDVFQGNIWGEGGQEMEREGGTSSKGGYREPAKMVNVVHRTCAGHHPQYQDAKPGKQDISVYFGELVYGNVGFAILGDRQFKSGPERVSFWKGRADHIKDESIDVSRLDKEGLVLLGDRQEAFLRSWVGDWRGHQMKVLLSQTVFAGVATHHGNYNGYLKGDLDSGGWPQTPRNNAIKILREGMPLHINGDQHLTTLSQYGVDQQRDGCWSFCTPAIAVGYPRWWRPDEMGMKHENRPQHGLPNTGEYLDGFDNKVFVYAVGNPEVATKKNRYQRAHQKGSGFGFVTIDTEKKTYLIDSYRFLIDPADGNPDNQFPGWPVSLQQAENKGENQLR